MYLLGHLGNIPEEDLANLMKFHWFLASYSILYLIARLLVFFYPQKMNER